MCLHMRKILLFGIIVLASVLVFSFSPQHVFAQTPTPVVCPAGSVPSDLGCIPQDPVGFVQTFYGWGLGFLGFVVVIFFIIGGYELMTSRGDSEKLNRGKSFIIYAIAGTLLAIFGFVFIDIITGALKIPGFS